MSERHRHQTAFAFGVAGIVAATGGFAVWQVTRMLFTILRTSYSEALRSLLQVTAKINSDSPDEVVPEELMLIDEEEQVYAYGELQELYFRRSLGGATDWQWSYDALEWFNTDDLAQDETLLLDPPSLIFIMRLHLLGVARRKIAAAGALAAPAAGRGTARHQRGSNSSSSRQHRPHIPPPLPLPEWAEQQMAQLHGAAACSSVPQPCQQEAGGAEGRQLLDAPDVLCCPITGQVMLQPVVTPSGKTFEYEALRRWITQHGRDPHSNEPLGLTQLYSNLLVRDMVEQWLATGDAVEGHSGGSSSSTAKHVHALHLQQQVHREGSEDPLSSFGASSSSGGSSDGHSWT